MRYKTKVEVRTNGRPYPPGAVLPEDISPADLAFLKSKRFIVPTDEVESDIDGEEDFEDVFEEFLKENELEIIKSPDEIRKLRSKERVAASASAIGYDLGENYKEKNLKDLQEEVVNFQEEKLDEEEELGSHGEELPGEE